ncbi:MAG: flagellar biosynthesis anti-sigma factor FlgM [Burkholderiaceae bacterium]
MKIGHPTDKPIATPSVTESKVTSSKAHLLGDAAAGAAGTSAGQASAKVLLSDAVSGLLGGKEPGKEFFDAVKVERLANAIAQGKFVVNPDVVADKLIANARELLGKTSH